MKNRILLACSTTLDLLMLTLLLIAPIQAQPTNTQRQERMEERRQTIQTRQAERDAFMKDNPEVAAEIQARRAKRAAAGENNPDITTRVPSGRPNREEFIRNNPETAAFLEERRAELEEFIRNNPEAGGARGGPRASAGPRAGSGEGPQRP